MARARKSHDTGKEEAKSAKSKLKPPYSGRVGGNKLVVYADLQREGDPCPRVLILTFAAEYAARHFIDLLIHTDEWEWIDPIGSRQAIKTSSGVRISMFKDDLKMLLEYKSTADEREWTDELMKQNTLRFKYGVHEEVKRKDDYEEPGHGAVEAHGERGASSSKSKRREPRVAKEPKVKVDKSGFISANDIAKELKLEGREVRGILRGKLTKPDIGWMWAKNSKELKEARKVIDEGAKALSKKKGK